MFKYKWKYKHCVKRTLRVHIIECLENIQYFYWYMVPYNFRPSNIWYKIKCFVWHRYTTVKARQLGHTWVDIVDLLPYTVFELLSRFIEQECSPGIVEWYGDYGSKIIPGRPYSLENEQHPDAIYVRDEMQYLYDWWHNIYLKQVETTYDKWHDYLEKYCNGTVVEFVPVEGSQDADGNYQLFDWNEPVYQYNEHEREADRLYKEAERLDKELDADLRRNLIRVINLRPFLWT